jgi:hypothetical protein
VHVLFLAAGGYALAWTVGFLLIPFPGGIGPRELALIAVLSPVMPRGSALVVALASRVVMTIGDLFWASVAVSVGRKQRREALEAGDTPATVVAPVAGGVPDGAGEMPVTSEASATGGVTGSAGVVPATGGVTGDAGVVPVTGGVTGDAGRGPVTDQVAGDAGEASEARVTPKADVRLES